MSAQEYDIHQRQKAKTRRNIHLAGTNIYPQSLSGNIRMKILTGFFYSISAFVLTAGMATSAGCARKTEALFTRPELINHSRLAVVGLSPEQEQIFMAYYTKAFPGQIIIFVERKRLQEIINEQDLLQGRLNEKTRAKIKQLFGVEAIIMCAYDDGTEGLGRKKLRIRIVDTATGAIVGSVITDAPDNFSYHCETAIKALKADLLSGR